MELSYPYLSKGHVTHKLMVIINRDKNEYNFTKGGVDLEEVEKGLQDLIVPS